MELKISLVTRVPWHLSGHGMTSTVQAQVICCRRAQAEDEKQILHFPSYDVREVNLGARFRF